MENICPRCGKPIKNQSSTHPDGFYCSECDYYFTGIEDKINIIGSEE